jgi:hypothetical protein
MKKILQYSLVLFTFLFVISCDEGFDELNENQVSPIAINPTFLLNNATITTSNDFNTLVYEFGIVQQIISPNSGVLAGANYNQDNRNATQGLWQRYYRTVVRNTVDVITQTKNDPTRSNLYNMARILKAYSLMVLTEIFLM